MFLNLAAAWKSFAQQIEEDDPDITEEDIEQYRRVFHCGAWATLQAQRAIVENYDAEPEAAKILLQAIWIEASRVMKEATDA